jgi:hypothetical protein
MFGQNRPAQDARHQHLASRWIAMTSGDSDDWLVTGILAGNAGKVATVVVGLPIVLLAGWAGVDPFEGFSGRLPALNWTVVAAALVAAPILESLLVWLSVWLLQGRLRRGLAATSLISGSVMAALHGASLVSVTVFPAFALQALILARWRLRGSPAKGYWSIVIAHLVMNGSTVWLAAIFM